jgi:VCBS repeat-containing protein
LTFIVDTTAPAAPTGLADASIAGGYVNKARDTAGQTLTGNAETGATVTIWDGATQLGTATADATGAWTFNLDVLADGVKRLTATATDAAGNTGAASTALTFTVDATAPCPVVRNVTGAAKGQSTVSGTSEAGSTVTLFDGGQQVGVATTGADGTWSVTLKLNGGQVHEFTETAVDLAGNTGSSAGSAYWANPANKLLAGGLGDDVLIGVKGDSLTGGGGHNHFVFGVGMGRQTVNDFVSGSDQICISHGLFADAASVLAHAQRSGSDTVITASGGDQIVLHGLTATLHAGDFMFF